MSELRHWLGWIAICATAFPSALWVMMKIGAALFHLFSVGAPLIAAFAMGVIAGLGWLILTIVGIERDRLARRRRELRETDRNGKAVLTAMRNHRGCQ